MRYILSRMSSETRAALDAKGGAHGGPLWRRLVIGRNPTLTLVRAIVLAVLCAIVFKFILLPIRVRGSSMAPTYHDGSVHFINLLSYRRHPPERGDVVAVQLAGPKLLLLKRVVGLPGEVVQVRDGVVWIDGQRVQDPHAVGSIPWQVGPKRLEPNEYFVIGDNRIVSDLHFKTGDQIMGKVFR